MNILQNRLANGINFQNEKGGKCTTCLLGKRTRQLFNRSLHKAAKDSTPEEMCSGEKAYAYVPEQLRKTLDPKSKQRRLVVRNRKTWA